MRRALRAVPAYVPAPAETPLDRARAEVAACSSVGGGYSPVPEWAAKAHRDASATLNALRTRGEDP